MIKSSIGHSKTKLFTYFVIRNITILAIYLLFRYMLFTVKTVPLKM